MRRDRVIQKAVLGLDIWPILAIFSCIVLVIATLISHTSVFPLPAYSHEPTPSTQYRLGVGRSDRCSNRSCDGNSSSEIIDPRHGAHLQRRNGIANLWIVSLHASSHRILLSLTISVLSSPNLQAINVEDDMGERYLEPSDFFKNGIPASLVAVVVIITVGYSIMRFMGM